MTPPDQSLPRLLPRLVPRLLALPRLLPPRLFLAMIFLL
jgi:hypothetical protein